MEVPEHFYKHAGIFVKEGWFRDEQEIFDKQFVRLLISFNLYSVYSPDKWTVSSAALRTRSTYRGCRVPPTSLIGSRSRSTYQGRWSRLRFSRLNSRVRQ